MQGDGNAVVYSPGHLAQWESHTAGHPGSTLAIQDDGNLVVIAPGNHPIWATNTVDAGKSVGTPRLQPAPMQPAPTPAATRYVALGDSYSAGEGLAPYLSPTATENDSCHRSSQAYSEVLARKPDAFVACSQQTTDAYYADRETEKAQRKALGADVGLVTLTMGGNNLGWTDTLLKCTKYESETVHNVIHETKDACQAALDATPGKIDAMKAALLTLYRDILNDAPNAQVRVLTYPPLFPLNRSGGGCRIARIHPVQLVIAADVEHQFGLYEQQANFAIIDAVNRTAAGVPGAASRLRVVDTETQFGGYLDKGHTVSCGDTGRPTPWINSIKLSSTDTALYLADSYGGNWDKVSADLFKIYSASFHPTVEGQRQMSLAVQATLS
jgi:lysophospholipase L1-like esterase